MATTSRRLAAAPSLTNVTSMIDVLLVLLIIFRRAGAGCAMGG